MDFILRNLRNAVTKEDYDFWKQMKEFKENGLEEYVLIALLLNDEWLDDYEVI